MAKILKQKKNIRVLSLGTGEKSFTPYESAADLTILAYVRKLGEFMMNMDAYASDYYLLNEFAENGQEANYLRMQTTSNVGMDKIDKANIDQLKLDGARLYEENKTKLEAMIRAILDENYGPTA